MKALALVGGAGRMGQALAEGLSAREDVNLVALVDEHRPHYLFGGSYVKSVAELKDLEVDVIVDFSSPEGVVDSARFAATHGVALVVGTTGLSDEQRQEVVTASEKVGVVIASNFSIGAVLAERFAVQAAPYFDRVEIIELHHDRKVDAPSGTSINAAMRIAAARRESGLEPLEDPTERHTLPGARGAEGRDGIRIHAVRLPGLVAHQEVIFGGPGEGLTLRHDSYDRQSFVNGVALAVLAVDVTPRLVEGIDELLN